MLASMCKTSVARYPYSTESLRPAGPAPCLPPRSVRWRSATADGACKFARLEPALVEYQEPTKVDRIARVDKQLAETKEVLHRTIESVLQRGEKLDDLVEKSGNLSAQSKMFYRTANKTSCCVIA